MASSVDAGSVCVLTWAQSRWNSDFDVFEVQALQAPHGYWC